MTSPGMDRLVPIRRATTADGDFGLFRSTGRIGRNADGNAVGRPLPGSGAGGFKWMSWPTAAWNRLLRSGGTLRGRRETAVFHFGEYPVQWGVFGRKVQRNDRVGKIAARSASRKDGIQRRRGDGRGDEFLRGQLKGSVPEMLSRRLARPAGDPRKAEPAGRLRCLRASVPRSVGT